MISRNRNFCSLLNNITVYLKYKDDVTRGESLKYVKYMATSFRQRIDLQIVLTHSN